MIPLTGLNALQTVPVLRLYEVRLKTKAFQDVSHADSPPNTCSQLLLKLLFFKNAELARAGITQAQFSSGPQVRVCTQICFLVAGFGFKWFL